MLTALALFILAVTCVVLSVALWKTREDIHGIKQCHSYLNYDQLRLSKQLYDMGKFQGIQYNPIKKEWVKPKKVI